MNIEELKAVLEEIAILDLADGSDIQDHPCSVAIRALDQCFDDVNTLRRMCAGNVNNKSKNVQVLVKMNYEPRW